MEWVSESEEVSISIKKCENDEFLLDSSVLLRILVYLLQASGWQRPLLRQLRGVVSWLMVFVGSDVEDELDGRKRSS